MLEISDRISAATKLKKMKLRKKLSIEMKEASLGTKTKQFGFSIGRSLPSGDKVGKTVNRGRNSSRREKIKVVYKIIKNLTFKTHTHTKNYRQLMEYETIQPL